MTNKFNHECTMCTSQGVFTYDMTVEPPQPKQCSYCLEYELDRLYEAQSYENQRLIEVHISNELGIDKYTHFKYFTNEQMEAAIAYITSLTQ